MTNDQHAILKTPLTLQCGLVLKNRLVKAAMGLSAGRMVMTPRVGNAFLETRPPITGDDVALGVVDFSIFPHLDYPGWDENTMAAAEEWAAGIGGPAYAIDDQTAIKVVEGKAEVVSEGHWRFFAA